MLLLAIVLAAAALFVPRGGELPLAVMNQPRLVRLTLEPPIIEAPRPAPLPVREPRNARERALLPFDRWVHPIPDDSRWLPDQDRVRFGAPRGGEREERCGRGHCGVDLFAIRSTPVVSIGDGVVERVEKDRRSRAGLYVTVAHEGGIVSEYMHLDHIRDDLVEGMPVVAGEWLGRLGRTGVTDSGAHLHFGIKVHVSKKRKRSVDPEPLLRQAPVIPLLDMVVGGVAQGPWDEDAPGNPTDDQLH